MDFAQYKEEQKKLGIASGDYYKLQSGENKIRILSKPEPTATHFLGKGISPAPCVEPCKHCENGLKTNYKIALYLLDRSDEQIKFAELPWSVFRSLGELAISSEYGFKDLPPYDVIIVKSGEGMETRYAVTPGRNEKPLTAAQQKELASKKPVQEILAGKMKQDEAVQTTPLDDVPDYEDKE